MCKQEVTQREVLISVFNLADGSSADLKVCGHLVLADTILFAKSINIVGINQFFQNGFLLILILLDCMNRAFTKQAAILIDLFRSVCYI